MRSGGTPLFLPLALALLWLDSVAACDRRRGIPRRPGQPRRRRGIDRLGELQNPDGSFQGPQAGLYPSGVTALAIYALAKSKVPTDDPAIQKGLAYLRTRTLQKILLVAEFTAGGKLPWSNEEAFLDEMSVGVSAR